MSIKNLSYMKKYYLLTLVICFLSSCNSNEIINNESNNADWTNFSTKSVEIVPDTIELKFIYHEQQYVSMALGYDDHIDIQNLEVKKIYDELQSKPMTALVRHDGLITPHI